MEKIDDGLRDVEQILQVERPRLLRLCSRITGNASVAEDMVQETLLEAWRHLDNLQDPEKFTSWLSGIARNVCLRWQQRQQRERLHLIEVPACDGDGMTTLAETLLDDCDVEIELERRELASLLDQAMDLLPRQTRTMLLERYVRDSPLADIAGLLGMNVNAVSMRLQRGKLALRRALAAELKLEAEDYAPQNQETWTQTSLWCHLCGQQRLLGKFQPEQLELYLKCPTCCPEPNDYISSNNGLEILRGVKSYKPALTRLSNWAHHYYRTALQEGAVPCCECGHMVPLRFHRPEYASTWLRQSGVPVIYLYCEHCHSCCYSALDHLALSLPELQQFRRNHPRIRTLPAVYDDVDGGRAMITRYESMTSAEQVEVVTSLENYRVLNIVGGLA